MVIHRKTFRKYFSRVEAKRQKVRWPENCNSSKYDTNKRGKIAENIMYWADNKECKINITDEYQAICNCPTQMEKGLYSAISFHLLQENQRAIPILTPWWRMIRSPGSNSLAWFIWRSDDGISQQAGVLSQSNGKDFNGVLAQWSGNDRNAR